MSKHGTGFPCPMCSANGCDVIDSRTQHGYIRRRRACKRCEHRFTTHETVVRKKNEYIPDYQI